MKDGYNLHSIIDQDVERVNLKKLPKLNHPKYFHLHDEIAEQYKEGKEIVSGANERLHK